MALVICLIVEILAAGIMGWRLRVHIALLGITAIVVTTTVTLDAIYFTLGKDPLDLGYCGEPQCDPGPIPATIGLVFLLPMYWAITATIGLVARLKRSRRAARACT